MAASVRLTSEVGPAAQSAPVGQHNATSDVAVHRYLANTKWQVRNSPFKHCVVENLFVPSVYERLCDGFDRKMTDAGDRAKRSKNYDAKILSFTEGDRVGLFPLLDFDFLSALAGAMGLEATFEVDAAIHRHPPGSRDGWIHTDYNPGWFIRAAVPGEVLLVDVERCNYRTGRVRDEKVIPILRMRHLAVIYYLNNSDWRQGDGGETGLYSGLLKPVAQPDVAVPPRDNSLLMFECSPFSRHAFLSTRRERNSIILWLHRDREAARAAWPEHKPESWF